MAQYGYRLFKTERMNGRGNTPVAFMDGKWGDFVEHLTRSYERQIGRKWHENPRDAFDSNGNAVPLDPNSRIVRLDWMHRSGDVSVLRGVIWEERRFPRCHDGRRWCC